MREISLEEYLRGNVGRGVIDFSLRASVNASGVVVFYIHPASAAGDTPDYVVLGNRLTQVNVNV